MGECSVSVLLNMWAGWVHKWKALSSARVLADKLLWVRCGALSF